MGTYARDTPANQAEAPLRAHAAVAVARQEGSEVFDTRLALTVADLTTSAAKPPSLSRP